MESRERRGRSPAGEQHDQGEGHHVNGGEGERVEREATHGVSVVSMGGGVRVVAFISQ